MKTIKISEDYARIIISRYKTDGAPGTPSGQEFRAQFLEPLFTDPNNTEKVKLDFDGLFGWIPSSMAEVFITLGYRYGKEAVLSRIEFVTTERYSLIKKALQYIDEGDKIRGQKSTFEKGQGV